MRVENSPDRREAPVARRRVLIVSDERPGDRVAGPGLRVAQLATVLGRRCEVTVAVPRCCVAQETPASIAVEELDPRGLEGAVASHDVTISRPGLLGLRHLRALAGHGHLVVDLTIPLPVEGLPYFAQFGSEGDRRYRTAQRRLRRALMAGDRFLVASPSQRLFWLGAVLTARDVPVAVGPEEAAALVIEAPTGVEGGPAPHGDAASDGDGRTVIWGGGAWPWTDPGTLVAAVASLRSSGVPDVVLRVPGTGHPVPGVPEGGGVEALRAQGRSLGLGDALRVDEGWRTRSEMAAVLSSGAVGVSLHRYALEAAVSWRQRLLDYVAARLPVLVSEGDPLGDRIVAAGGGLAVPVGDVEACRAALHDLLRNDELRRRCRRALDALARELAPERTMADLVAYCMAPRRAPDAGRRSWHRLARTLLG